MAILKINTKLRIFLFPSKLLKKRKVKKRRAKKKRLKKDGRFWGKQEIKEMIGFWRLEYANLSIVADVHVRGGPYKKKGSSACALPRVRLMACVPHKFRCFLL